MAETTKIFYSVEYSVYGTDDGPILDGNKVISVYRVRNNDLEMLTNIESDIEEYSEDVVEDFLDGEGFENYFLVKL